VIDAEIYDAFAAAVTTFAGLLSPPLPVAFPNVQFEPPDSGPWLEVSWFPNETQNYGIGNAGPSIHLGFGQIAVVARKGAGLAVPMDIAGAALAAFTKGTLLGPARIYRKGWISSVVQEPDRVMIPVTLPYRAAPPRDAPPLTELFTYEFTNTQAVQLSLTGTDIGPVWTWSGGGGQTGNVFSANVTSGDTITLEVAYPNSITGITLGNNGLLGALMDLTLTPNLVSFSCNQGDLSGNLNSVPSLSSLELFGCGGNPNITGAIPEPQATLIYLDVSACGMAGNIPSLSDAPLTDGAYFSDNIGITGLAVGATFPSTITAFYADGCALTESAVDAILAALVTAGVVNCDINLSGGTNAPPSASGLVSKAALELEGCTVTVNS